jgi:hypothetical protein
MITWSQVKVIVEASGWTQKERYFNFHYSVRLEILENGSEEGGGDDDCMQLPHLRIRNSFCTILLEGILEGVIVERSAIVDSFTDFVLCTPYTVYRTQYTILRTSQCGSA